jgi:hypothetical protein
LSMSTISMERSTSAASSRPERCGVFQRVHIIIQGTRPYRSAEAQNLSMPASTRPVALSGSSIRSSHKTVRCARRRRIRQRKLLQERTPPSRQPGRNVSFGRLATAGTLMAVRRTGSAPFAAETQLGRRRIETWRLPEMKRPVAARFDLKARHRSSGISLAIPLMSGTSRCCLGLSGPSDIPHCHFGLAYLSRPPAPEASGRK